MSTSGSSFLIYLTGKSFHHFPLPLLPTSSFIRSQAGVPTCFPQFDSRWLEFTPYSEQNCPSKIIASHLLFKASHCLPSPPWLPTSSALFLPTRSSLQPFAAGLSCWSQVIPSICPSRGLCMPAFCCLRVLPTTRVLTCATLSLHCENSVSNRPSPMTPVKECGHLSSFCIFPPLCFPN